MAKGRRCGNAGCPNVVTVAENGNRRYCSKRCQDRAAYLRKKVRRAELVAPAPVVAGVRPPPAVTVRGGQAYEAFVGEGWPARIEAGLLSQADVAVAMGVTAKNVSAWFAGWRQAQIDERRHAAWVRTAEVDALLEPTAGAFAAFRARYFEDEWGVPYVTMGYHLVWIAALLTALLSGGRLMILSPPRHGKTQLLIHFCVWLIIRNPNIRLIWIGLNEDNAQEAVGAVRDILENHRQLRLDVIGPERWWRPAPKTGRSWTDGKFTVATREGVGIKSPTMRAVGKRGKLLSKDADFVFLDDIQDREAYDSPASREMDVRWVNSQVSSRKEAHTGIGVIGSRQHHEDLYGRLEGNSTWTSIVESAHSLSCNIPVHEPHGEHTYDCPDCARHEECVLWPGKRTMAYLQDQRAAMDDDLMFEMVYLNVTRPSSDQYVTQLQLDACKNPTRSIGRWLDDPGEDGGRRRLVMIPSGCSLIAGLDPAVRGYQAAVLWAYQRESQVRYLIDIDNRPAGGLPGARAIIREWWELYGLQSWVVERNNYQEAILQDRDIVDFCQINGVHLEPHFTSRQNKSNHDFGVTKQLELFGKNLIDLPWGDEPTRAKVRVISKQWLNYEPETSGKTDLVMAGWFPEGTFRRWRRDQHSDAEVGYEQTSYPQSLGDTYSGMTAA